MQLLTILKHSGLHIHLLLERSHKKISLLNAAMYCDCSPNKIERFELGLEDLDFESIRKLLSLYGKQIYVELEEKNDDSDIAR